MPEERDSGERLAEARKAIERDAERLRDRWGQAREEAVEGFNRLTWIGQLGSLLFRLRGWMGGPERPDR
ncbi:MAG TPA: hypothetical protein VKW09_01655 [bacterium]|nr:hypothetical protein [bacterium]